jgi:uracil-DNA glycosylase family 4
MFITNTSEEDMHKISIVSLRINGDMYSPHRNRLRQYEDKMLLENSRRILVLEKEQELQSDVVKSATFPFYLCTPEAQIFNKEVRLEALWKAEKCTRCKGVVYRHTMPTGNMNPTYLFIGEAPGVSDGEKVLERVMGYGPTSSLFRAALLKENILHKSWLTNILKCALPGNKSIDDEQYENCFEFLLKEIEILSPKKIIALGNKVSDFLSMKGFRFSKVVHPSFCVRKGINYEKYAQQYLSKVI